MLYSFSLRLSRRNSVLSCYADNMMANTRLISIKIDEEVKVIVFTCYENRLISIDEIVYLELFFNLIGL